jgi:hypothetical protein
MGNESPVGGRPKGNSERTAPASAILPVQAQVFRRVDDVDPGPDDGRGPAADGEGPLVGRRVDAPGQAAHDAEAALGELGAEPLRDAWP